MGILGQIKPSENTETLLYQVPVNNEANVFVNISNGLPPPFAVNTASYDGVSFSVSAQDTSPYDIAFSSDGFKLFVLGYTNKNIFQYSLSAPFDLSTASYDSVSFSVNAQDTAPYGLAFSSDGTKLFVSGSTNKNIFQYSLSAPFDLSTASYDSVSFSVSAQDTQPYDIAFSSDGFKLFVLGYTNKNIFQYSLSTPFAVNTASYDSVSFSVNAQDNMPRALAVSSDGTKFFVLGYTNDTIFQYSFSTAFDLSTASYDGVSFSVSAQDTQPYDIAFNSNGTKVFVSGGANDTIFQYSTDNPTESIAEVYLQQAGETLPTEEKERILSLSMDKNETVYSTSYNLSAGERIVVKSDTEAVSFTANGMLRGV